MWIWRRIEKIVWTDLKTKFRSARDAGKEPISSENNYCKKEEELDWSVVT